MWPENVAAGSTGPPAALTAVQGAPTLPGAKEAPVEDESYLGNLEWEADHADLSEAVRLRVAGPRFNRREKAVHGPIE